MRQWAFRVTRWRYPPDKISTVFKSVEQSQQQSLYVLQATTAFEHNLHAMIQPSKERKCSQIHFIKFDSCCTTIWQIHPQQRFVINDVSILTKRKIEYLAFEGHRSVDWNYLQTLHFLLITRIRLFNLTLNRANNLSWQVRSPDNPLNEKKEKKKHPHTLVLNKYTTGYLCAITLIRIHAYFLGFLTLLRLFRCFCIEAL